MSMSCSTSFINSYSRLSFVKMFLFVVFPYARGDLSELGLCISGVCKLMGAVFVGGGVGNPKRAEARSPNLIKKKGEVPGPGASDGSSVVNKVRTLFRSDMQTLFVVEKVSSVHEPQAFNEPRDGKKLLVLDLDECIFNNSSKLKTENLELMEHEEMFKIIALVDKNCMCEIDGTNAKPLEVIWSKFPQHYHRDNTIMLDDQKHNFLCNPQNGLEIKAWKNTDNNAHLDTELVDLGEYLEWIATHEKTFSKLDHGKWRTYLDAEQHPTLRHATIKAVQSKAFEVIAVNMANPEKVESDSSATRSIIRGLVKDVNDECSPTKRARIEENIKPIAQVKTANEIVSDGKRIDPVCNKLQAEGRRSDLMPAKKAPIELMRQIVSDSSSSAQSPPGSPPSDMGSDSMTAVARRALKLVDLTSLNDTDDDAKIEALCDQARTTHGAVAAVCVYPRFVKLAKEKLARKEGEEELPIVKVATVANFPDGGEDVKKVVAEVDVVFPYAALKRGDEDVGRELIADQAVLKVIFSRLKQRTFPRWRIQHRAVDLFLEDTMHVLGFGVLFGKNLCVQVTAESATSCQNCFWVVSYPTAGFLPAAACKKACEMKQDEDVDQEPVGTIFFFLLQFMFDVILMPLVVHDPWGTKYFLASPSAFLFGSSERIGQRFSGNVNDRATDRYRPPALARPKDIDFNKLLPTTHGPMCQKNHIVQIKSDGYGCTLRSAGKKDAETKGAGVHLKVIIESGELVDAAMIRKASEISIAAGADFIKTSTGKKPISATPEAAREMLTVLKDNLDKSKTKDEDDQKDKDEVDSKVSDTRVLGFKAAGGIKTTEQADIYLSLADEIMGKEWVSADTFRFGASSLLTDLVKQIEAETQAESEQTKESTKEIEKDAVEETDEECTVTGEKRSSAILLDSSPETIACSTDDPASKRLRNETTLDLTLDD
eukprot:gene332-256_t